MSLNEVVVVKYVNPHLFWIRESEDASNLAVINKCLARDLNNISSISAEANELVAVRDTEGLKRAIVIDVNDGFNCWLLDHGLSVVATEVYRLSERLAVMLPTIKMACLDNIVGIAHSLNIETFKDEIKNSVNFEAHTIQYVEYKLRQAKHIYFSKERKIGDFFCGNFILDIDGVKCNIADLLVREGRAAVDKDLFLEALKEYNCIIPVSNLYDSAMADSSTPSVCSVEGIGRGVHRIKAAPSKDEQVAAWVQNVQDHEKISKPRGSNPLKKIQKRMKASDILKALTASEKELKDFSTSSCSDSSSIVSDGKKSSSEQSNSHKRSSSDDQSLKQENNALKGVVMPNHFPCKCENCHKIFDDEFDEAPKTFTEEIKQTNEFYRGKPQPLIKVDSGKSNTFVVKKSQNQTKIEKDMAPNLLVHSPGHLPTPSSNISNVPFCVSVHNALSALKYKTLRSMQMYMWPAIMRSMNVCIVDDKSKGKTMCYLPALCSFLIQKQERYPFLPKEPSPIAVVLCHSIRKAEHIYDLLSVFLTRLTTRKKVDIALLVPPVEESLIKQLKKAEIIVATPKIFVRILASHTINLKRLCHLIIEDIDKVLNETLMELHKIMKAAQSMLDHRIFVNTVQIVMISETWSIALEDFVRKLESLPVICIGSHLQSVIYAKASIKMQFLKKEEKSKRIASMLKETSKELKTIILCSTDEEVLDAANYFQILGISVVVVTQSMMREEVEEKEVLWMSTPPSNNSVFICTDYSLHTQLSITTARVLIHYSLPDDSWSLFTRRFKCVIDTLDSPFNSNFNKVDVVKVHIFVDESCNKQFPRLYHFLQQTKTKLPEHFKTFCEKLENAEEYLKIKNRKPICKRVKLHGKCTKFRCKKRHLLSIDIDEGEDVPKSGIITFKILNVTNVTQFGIKILKHWDTKGKKCDIKDYTSLVTKDLRNCTQANKLMVTDVKVGSLYVHFDAKEVTYHRCKVLEILSRQQITNAAHEIRIKLIDDGMEKKTFASLLFELSSEFLEIPPQSIEARLANIVPLERDTEWNLRTKAKVEKMINDLIKSYPEAYFVGRIVLQVGGTVWLEDIVMREDIDLSKETVTLLTLKKKLTSLDLVDYDESPLNNLRDLCVKSGFDLPDYEVEVKPKIEKVNQVEPQWAHLDTRTDVYNIVYFSHAESPKKFFVKLEKFFDLYAVLEEEIQADLKKPFYPSVDQIVPGHCYLAKDSIGDVFNRVMVKKIDGNIASCFFVDFGDTVDVPLDELKYLSNEHISKLPFQAIECELYGIKSITDIWPQQATSVFYKFCYVPHTDVFRDLYVNVVSTTASDYGCKCYSVAMLDYFEEKQTVINKILIDCGLAIDDDKAKLEDLFLPELTFNNEQESGYNDDFDDAEKKEEAPNFEEFVECLPNKCDVPQELLDEIENCSIENGGLDFACSDFKTFMSELVKKKPIINSKQITTNLSKNTYVPMKVVPSTSYYTPNVLWYQTNTTIIMEIQLPNVNDYSAVVLRKKLFLFNTKLNNKDYVLNIPLFDSATNLEKLNTGLFVRITLTKIKEEEWPRLAKTTERMRNIKFDLTKLKEEEPKKRRFLDHGFGSSDDDDDYPVIHNISSDDDTESDSDIE